MTAGRLPSIVALDRPFKINENWSNGCKQIAQGSLYYNNEDEFLEFSCSWCGNEWNNGWPVRLSLLMSIDIYRLDYYYVHPHNPWGVAPWLIVAEPMENTRQRRRRFLLFFVIILFPFLGDVWCSSFLSASVRYIHFRSPPSFFFLFLMAAFDGEAILSHPPTPELPSVCIITTTQSLRHHTTIEYIQPATHLFIIV